jgi:hypothetical protein
VGIDELPHRPGAARSGAGRRQQLRALIDYNKPSSLRARAGNDPRAREPFRFAESLTDSGSSRNVTGTLRRKGSEIGLSPESPRTRVPRKTAQRDRGLAKRRGQRRQSSAAAVDPRQGRQGHGADGFRGAPAAAELTLSQSWIAW